MNRRTAGIGTLVALAFLAGHFAFAQLKPPPLADRESGGAVATEDGKARWKNRWTMERAKLDGKPAAHFTETGEGMHSPFTEEVRWVTESWWSVETTFRPLRFDKTFTGKDGAAVMRETAEFDWIKHQTRFERQDLKKGTTEKETFELPDDTLSVEGIAAALRAVPFAEGKVVAAHLLSNEPKLYEITLELRGKESCKTARGAVDCYKLEMVPHLGVLNILRFALPKSYFWFSADPAHEWLRYEGLEGGRGTPEIVMEPGK